MDAGLLSHTRKPPLPFSAERPTQERSSLPLVEKASRRAAAKIRPPPGGIVSFGLSGSPPCTMGTLSDKSDGMGLLSDKPDGSDKSDKPDESDKPDGAEYRPAAPSQLPLPALPPSTSSSAPILAPWRPPCRSRRERARRPTGPTGPIRERPSDIPARSSDMIAPPSIFQEMGYIWV